MSGQINLPTWSVALAVAFVTLAVSWGNCNNRPDHKTNSIGE